MREVKYVTGAFMLTLAIGIWVFYSDQVEGQGFWLFALGVIGYFAMSSANSEPPTKKDEKSE